jgi:Sec-independent protein translocase protein TatA
MKVINENRLLKVIVSLLLIVSIVVVIALGEKRQSKLAKQLLTTLKEMEVNKKSDNKESDSKKVEDNKAIPAAANKVYTYEGVKELGKYNNLRWRNKKWYALGDNVKNADGYTSRIKTLAAANLAFNDAEEGRVMADMSKNITSEKLKDIELITVLAGASDYSAGTPLGSINDDENAATFYGGLKKVINDILELKPDAAIVFITPLNQSSNANRSGIKLESYAKAINEVCKTYNILVLDLYAKSGINEKNIKSYTTDNVNLNSQGIQKVSQVISNYIKTIK